MNLLFRSLYLLFPPRLPKFGREDVAVTAEYFNRMARHHEWTTDPPGTWVELLPAQLTARIPLFKVAVKVSQRILRRVAPPSKSLAGAEWTIVLMRAPTRRAFEWFLSTALSFFSPMKPHLTSAEGRFRGRASP